jgi:hypothetical protein
LIGGNSAGLKGGVARERYLEAERESFRPARIKGAGLSLTILVGLSPKPAGIGAGLAAFVGQLIELVFEALLAILEIL